MSSRQAGGWLVVVVVVGASYAAALRGRALVESMVLEALRRSVAAEVAVGDFELSILPPRLGLSRVEVSEAGRRWIGADRIEFRLSAVTSLWQGSWIGSLRLEAPEVAYEPDSPFWQNLARLAKSGSGSAAGGPSILPQRIEVERGRVTVRLPKIGLDIDVAEVSGHATATGVLRRRIPLEVSAKVHVARAGREIDLRIARIRGALESDGMSVESLEVDGDAGALRASGEIRSGRLRGQLSCEAALDPIFSLVPEAGIVRGRGRASATLGGSQEAPEVAADLEAESVRIEDVEFSGRGRLESRARDWKLESARAAMFGGEVEGSAQGRWTSGIPFEAQARFRGWSPSAFVRLFGPEIPVRGAWDGDASLAGLLLGDDLSGRGDFILGEQGGKLKGRASFRVAADSAAVDGELEAGPEDRLRARFELLHRQTIGGDVEVHANRLELFAPFLGLALAGQGEAAGRFSGTVDRPVLAGRVDATEIGVGAVRFAEVHGPLEISTEGVRSSRLEAEGGKVRFEGRLAATADQANDWSAEIHRVDLGRLLGVARLVRPEIPEVEGEVEGTVRVEGKWRQPRMSAEARVGDVGFGPDRLGDLDARMSIAGERWTVDSRLRRADGASADIELGGALGGEATARIRASGWKLETIATLRDRRPDLEGIAAFEASLRGTLARPIGRATLRLSALKLADRPLGDAAAEIEADGRQALWEMRSALGIHASGAVSIAAPNTFRLRTEWRDLELSPWLAAPAEVELRSTGTAELAGDRTAPIREGRVTIEGLSLARGSQRLANRDPIVLTIDRGALDLREAILEGAGQRIVVAGSVAGAKTSLHASVHGDLGLLETLGPAVGSARGRLEAEVAAERRGDGEWHYRGQAAVHGGALDIGFLVGATEVEAEAEFADRRIEVHQLTGRLGGGDFLFAGTVGLDEGWDIGWALHDVSLGFPAWLDHRASGNGRLAGPTRRPKLSGEIEVTQAVYDQRIEWAEFLPWFRREIRPSRRRPAVPLDLDFRIFAAGGLFIDNNLANGEMRGDLRVSGSAENPRWTGSLDVLSGEFVFRRRRFTIRSGTVRFREAQPFDPDLEFSGETEVATRDAEYEIQVRVSGTAERPRIEFSADDPSLTENDILALVTFGKTVAQLQTQGAGIELADVLALTAGPRAGEVEERLHRIVPVDRIEIEPAYSRTTGVTEPRLSIAKDLTERLSAVIGSGLGAERSQDVGVEYQVTRRIFLQGVWESQTKSEGGAFGATLKFRLPFRRLPRFSLLSGVAER